jgi:hypothetical protein
MSIQQVSKNDVGNQLSFTITNKTGVAVDLTDATVTLNMVGGIVKTTLSRTCTVDSALAGTCHYDLVADDTKNPGKYELTLTVTYSGGSKYTTITYGELEILG